MHYICYFVRFCFNDNKNTKLKKYKNIEKNKKEHKNMFLNFYKNIKHVFSSMVGLCECLDCLLLELRDLN